MSILRLDTSVYTAEGHLGTVVGLDVGGEDHVLVNIPIIGTREYAYEDLRAVV